MNVWNSLSGIIQVCIVSPDPAFVLLKLSAAGIAMFRVEQVDALRVNISIQRRDHRPTAKILDAMGLEWNIKNRTGMYWNMLTLLKRPVLLLGILFLVSLIIYLPTRVLFIKVDGNRQLTDMLILEAAEECGIRFGCSRKTVRSEKVKNQLLGAIPELQWAGINTAGCVATIHVQERAATEQTGEENKTVSSIIAVRDGIVLSATAKNGNLQCYPGQAVRAGQTLISGYTDCGIAIRATQAEGEVLAQTHRDLEAITPLELVRRGILHSQTVRYGIMIGKKLINFYKDSGICDTTCVKIYSEKFITLPGGFQLPIALVAEQRVSYETSQDLTAAEEISFTIEEIVRRYLTDHMVAGQVLSTDTSHHIDGETYFFYGKYACLEMIGQVRYEERMYIYGENNREDR